MQTPRSYGSGDKANSGLPGGTPFAWAKEVCGMPGYGVPDGAAMAYIQFMLMRKIDKLDTILAALTTTTETLECKIDMVLVELGFFSDAKRKMLEWESREKATIMDLILYQMLFAAKQQTLQNESVI
ncbi:hypothetical protein NDU88_002547 [Pleurodeles waltl]|uniref:Uncharacterized protein n=1 Tax=Pleurodeles waltl TaxID=8319 RepID=A0AAV7M6B0_PLEWA|nr:hypothetical protein NDU88_002547 [Pleurodeles waltl]